MHFYCSKTAEPKHVIKMASGKTRPSTSRDAAKNGWNPSVSTIMSITGDEALFNWQKEQIIDACWLHPFESGTNVQEWKKEIRKLSDMKRLNSANDGHRIHAALETIFKTDMSSNVSDLDREICHQVYKYIRHEFGDVEWKAEHTFARNGFGGCVDLHSKNVIIDFKTQATSDVNNFRYYDKYCMQLAAYRDGLNLTNADCYILKVSSTTPGVFQLKKYNNKQLDKSLNLFYTLLKYWNIKNGRE